ncbi:hypothetical protein HDE_13124 [Halotydeus destructor]|nr:hypothetical protein HDE_13124 [Halotydeus destructor]
MTSKCNDASVDSGFSVDIVELSSDEDDVVESKTISATPNVTETPSTASVVSCTHAPNTVESSTDMLRHVHLELMPRLASILSATPGLTTAENNTSSSKRSSTATAEVSPKRPKLNSAPEPDGVITESRKDDTSQSCTKNQELTKTKSPRKQAQSRTCDTTLDQEMVTESTETTREFTAAEGVPRSNTCDSLAEKQDVPKTKSPEKRHEVSAKLPKTGKASEPGLSGVITSNAKENTAQSLAKNRELSNVNSPKKQGRPRNPVPETTTGMTNTTRNSADIEVAPSMRNICKSVAKKPEPTKANSPKKRGRPKKVDTRSDPVAEMATDPTEMTRERTAAELASRYNILDIEYVYSEDEYVKLNTHDKFSAFWRTELVNVNPDKSCRKYVILLIAAKWKEFQPIIPVKKKTRVEIVESLLKKYKLKDANFVAKATEAQPVDMDTFRAQLKPKLRSLNPCADLQVLLRLIFYKYNVYRNRREFRPLVAQVLEKGAMKDCDCSFDKATCLAQISFQDFLAHVRPRLVAANPTTGDEHIRQLVAAKWRQFKKDRRVLPKIPFHSAVPVEKLSGELVPSKFTEAGERPKIKKEWIGEICEMCSLFEPPSRLKKDKPGVSEPSSFIDWATCDLCDKWFHRDCLIQPTAKNHRDVYVLDAAGKVTKYFCSDCAPRNE